MRKTLNFPKEVNDKELIISKEEPEDYDHKKKIVLSRGINEEEYDEVYRFLRDNNKMSSGNYTLLPKSEIERFQRLNVFSILMRGEKNKKLYGTIFSLPFPIKCSVENKNETIVHGCTSFLNIETNLRKFNMCSILIKDLAKYGYENKIYCSYQMTSFKLCETSFQISSYFRPINLLNSIALGFVPPDILNIKKMSENRMKYKCKIPKSFSLKRVLNKNKEKSLEFYNSLIKDKKFAFSPDLILFSKWIQEFPTYLVRKDKKNIGIFSITNVFCRMGNEVEGKLCLPLLFNAIGSRKEVLKCLLSVAEERENDVLYCYSVGDLDSDTLKSVNAIQNIKKTWFSLYNNAMKLTEKDLYVPLI